MEGRARGQACDGSKKSSNVSSFFQGLCCNLLVDMNIYRAIQALVKLIQPILDGVCEATGWKCSFFAGGPEPAQGGLLNVLR